MNGEPAGGRAAFWRRLGRVALIALAAALLYQAVGAVVFLPRFGSEDPREVVTAYFEAQRWGYRALAERALDADLRDSYHAPNAVRGLADDALLSRDLETSEAARIGLRGEHGEERQVTVRYSSLWRGAALGPAGSRLFFVYVGRDADGPWRILSIGTGP